MWIASIVVIAEVSTLSTRLWQVARAGHPGMDAANAAKCCTASVFCAAHSQDMADKLEQRCITIDDYNVVFGAVRATAESATDN